MAPEVLIITQITRVITHYQVIMLPQQGSNCRVLTRYLGNSRVITHGYQRITQCVTQWGQKG